MAPTRQQAASRSPRQQSANKNVHAPMWEIRQDPEGRGVEEEHRRHTQETSKRPLGRQETSQGPVRRLFGSKENPDHVAASNREAPARHLDPPLLRKPNMRVLWGNIRDRWSTRNKTIEEQTPVVQFNGEASDVPEEGTQQGGSRLQNLFSSVRRAVGVIRWQSRFAEVLKVSADHHHRAAQARQEFAAVLPQADEIEYVATILLDDFGEPTDDDEDDQIHYREGIKTVMHAAQQVLHTQSQAQQCMASMWGTAETHGCIPSLSGTSRTRFLQLPPPDSDHSPLPLLCWCQNIIEEQSRKVDDLVDKLLDFGTVVEEDHKHWRKDMMQHHFPEDWCLLIDTMITLLKKQEARLGPEHHRSEEFSAKLKVWQTQCARGEAEWDALMNFASHTVLSDLS